jgi:NAD(P)H dehydrogenase (quinone)
MNRARIIVTGATGKTGSVVVTELLKARYPVRALSAPGTWLQR